MIQSQINYQTKIKLKKMINKYQLICNYNKKMQANKQKNKRKKLKK